MPNQRILTPESREKPEFGETRKTGSMLKKQTPENQEKHTMEKENKNMLKKPPDSM